MNSREALDVGAVVHYLRAAGPTTPEAHPQFHNQAADALHRLATRAKERLGHGPSLSYREASALLTRTAQAGTPGADQ